MPCQAASNTRHQQQIVYSVHLHNPVTPGKFVPPRYKMETDWLSSFLQTGLRLQLPECSVFSVSRRCSSLRSLLLSLPTTPRRVSTNPSRVLSSWASWGAILSTCRGNPGVLLGMVSRDIQRGPSPVPTPFIAVCPSYPNSCALIGDFCVRAQWSLLTDRY